MRRTLIVGGGITGSALALALAERNCQVTLIERQPAEDEFPSLDETVTGFGERVSTLNWQSHNFLQQLGIWQDVAAQRFLAFIRMTVWDGDGSGYIHFTAAENDLSALGFIVENKLIQVSLNRRLKQHPHIQRIEGEVTHITQSASDCTAIMDNGDTLQGEWIIGADGAQSHIGKIGGFRTHHWDYHQHAIIATIQCEKSHQHTAWQRFMTTGPLAFLPLGGKNTHFYSIVWSCDRSLADDLIGMDDTDFAAALGTASEFCCGDIQNVSSRKSFPLHHTWVMRNPAHRIVLIGDAAQRIHPLAGQGLNLGLSDAARVAVTIAQGTRSINQAQWLSHSFCHHPYHVAMGMAIGGLHHLFKSDALLLRWVRNSGIQWVEKQQIIKRWFVAQAALGN